jgi:hypothetical protein
LGVVIGLPNFQENGFDAAGQKFANEAPSEAFSAVRRVGSQIQNLPFAGVHGAGHEESDHAAFHLGYPEVVVEVLDWVPLSGLWALRLDFQYPG